MICGEMTLKFKQKQLPKMELPKCQRHCQGLKKKKKVKGYFNQFYKIFFYKKLYQKIMLHLLPIF